MRAGESIHDSGSWDRLGMKIRGGVQLKLVYPLESLVFDNIARVLVTPRRCVAAGTKRRETRDAILKPTNQVPPAPLILHGSQAPNTINLKI